MFKVISMLKRNPALTPEQFRKHYEEVHAPLARKTFPFIRKYVRNYVMPAPAGKEPGFDCITEQWFDDKGAFKKMTEIYATEAGRPVWEDEKKVFDMTRLELLFVEEVS
jgi:uncharacterized protein (TIGR02118 family)